jgi:Tfp pilus assembly protein PilO
MKACIDEPLPLRILTLIVLIAGFVFVYRPAEARLALARTQTQALQANIVFGENVLTKHRDYERAAENMRRNFAGMTRASSQSTLTAGFLDDVASKTREEHVVLAEVAPTHAAPGDDTFTLHVNGPYRSVIAFLNDLTTMHTLARLDGLTITRLSDNLRAGQTPLVEATIDASLIPLQSEN